MKKAIKGPTDYELVVKAKNGDEKAKLELFNRYELLMFQQYHKLKKLCFENKWTGIELGTPEQYKLECWEPFCKALKNANIETINHCPVWDCKKQSGETLTEWRARRKVVGYEDHSATWKFYLPLWGYIKKMNEMELNSFIKRCKAEVPIYTTSKDDNEYSVLDTNLPESLAKSPEDKYFEDVERSITQRAIKKAYSSFSQVQKNIWDKKSSGYTDTEITRSLKITKSTFNNNLTAMWDIYKSQLKREKIKG